MSTTEEKDEGGRMKDEQDRSSCSSFILPPSSFSSPSLLTLLIALGLWACYARPFADLDFAWQVRTGGIVARTGQLRVEDTFTYTIAGKQLPDFEWVYEVGLWSVWSVAGYGGLHLLKVVCVAAPLVLLGWRLRREGVGRYAIVLSILVAVLVLIPTWNLRPFYCTTVGLLLLSGWLHDHCAGRRPLSWETPLLMLVWANSHPGVITGQGLLAGAIGWEWLNRWWRLNPPLSAAACRRLTFFGGLGLLATFACPGPIERLRYTFNPDLAHPIMRGFTEMMPLHFFALRPPFLFALTYLVAALVLWTLVQRFRAYRLWEVALLAGLTVLGSFALRSVQDWLLVMLALGVPHAAVLFRERARRHRQPGAFRVAWQLDRIARRVLGSYAFRFQPGWVPGLAGLLAFYSLAVSNHVPRRHAIVWPEAVVDHIEAHDLRGNFFASANHGAYLVWRRGPDKARCYVDTRGFFFPPRLLEDALYVPQMAEGWRERLERVLDGGTDYLLFEADGPAGALWRALEPQVRPLYRDSSVVLIEAAEVRAWLAQTRGISAR